MSYNNRKNFATSSDIPNYPDFLDIQVKSFKSAILFNLNYLSSFSESVLMTPLSLVPLDLRAEIKFLAGD